MENQKVLDKAVLRLLNINKKLSRQDWEDLDREEPIAKVCHTLCEYFKMEIKLPPKERIKEGGNLAEEIFYLSGLNYKEVSLPGDWHCHNNGAMLGKLEDGTPVALLPNRISGYTMYDPRKDKGIKVNAHTESKISREAVMVFCKFLPGTIRIKEIVRLISRDNIQKEIMVLLLCSLISGVIRILPPILSAQIFDVIVPEKQRALLIQTVFILTAFGVAEIGVSIIMNLGISRIHTKSGFSVQAALWNRLLSLKMSFFHQFTTGELIQRINGIEQIKDLISVDRIKILLANLFAFINIAVLFQYCAGITPYVLLLLLWLFLVYGMVSVKKCKWSHEYRAAENKAVDFHHQSVYGMHRIKVSGAEEAVYNRWSLLEAEKYQIKNRMKRLDGFFRSFCIFFRFFSSAAVYFLISREQDVAMGAFIAYLSGFLILWQSAEELLEALDVVPEIISVCRDIKPVLEAVPEYSISKIVPKDMRGTLEVNHATFRYEEYGQTILSDISFRIEEGESIGIVGLSGSGKSTLLKVLMGFYELTSGTIHYGGYDLETIDLRCLRKHFGVVLQDGRLIAGDIYGSITDNDRSIQEEEVWDVMRNVGLDEMIRSLPDGLHTRLEHQLLSDGEKQKLLIARAIIRKSKFIFLDEATGSLDNVSQRLIMKSIMSLPATKIMVAQRLDAVEQCDKILVIEHGKISLVIARDSEAVQ